MKLFSRRKKSIPSYPKEIFVKKIEDLQTLPHGITGGIEIDSHRFYFHDARCFYDSYIEIWKDGIYKFNTSSECPVIIDCGANMGVSVLFFAKEYPKAKIIAFEPETAIYQVLQNNIASFHLTNVELHCKAVWDSVTTLEFMTDHGMGGSVTNTFSNQASTKVETVRLADYLNQRVDFLKLDIEGAEYTVLKDCEPLLKNVQHIFVEYHSYINKEQKLEEVLNMLKGAGFRYHLKQSFSQQRPFVDRLLACENMDMAITIFAYKEEQAF
jgi:FkbM family methyltransferase